jgi:hypothetical protein
MVTQAHYQHQMSTTSLTAEQINALFADLLSQPPSVERRKAIRGMGDTPKYFGKFTEEHKEIYRRQFMGRVPMHYVEPARSPSEYEWVVGELAYDAGMARQDAMLISD